MKIIGLVLVALMMNATATSQTMKEPGKRQGGISYSASAHNEELVLDKLRLVLRSSGYTGRVYYAGRCAADGGGDFVCFPAIKVHQPIGGGFRAIESIFRGDSSVKVSKKLGGVVSIRIGKVPTAVLQTRLPMFRLSPLEQYNPDVAIEGLLNTPEVNAAMVRLRLHLPLTVSGQLMSLPAKGEPHLPNSMRGMTADQILDSIAATFHGIVVYGICPESRTRMYSVDFTGLEPDIE